MQALKLSCADFTFPLLDHDKVIDLIAMLDFKGIDIGLFSGRSHITAETEFSDLINKARALRRKVEQRGMSITDVYLQLDNNLAKFAINHPEENIRQYARAHFAKLMEYASESGADHITCLPGMHFSGERIEDSVKRSYEELDWRVDQSKKYNLQFSVEVHTGSPFIIPNDAAALLAAVPGLTLTLDYTHFIRNGYLPEDVHPLLGHTSHFHARGATKNKLQASVTENTIDYGDILKRFKKINYDGWVGLEYIWIEWEQCNQVDTLSETIRLKTIIEQAYNQ